MKALQKKKKNTFSEKVRKRTEGIRKLSHKILLVTNLLLVAAIVISYISVYINPSFFAFPALFGLAYPYLLLANVIMILIWAALRKKEALISVAAILLGLGYFNNFIKLRNHGREVKPDIMMLSYNVRLFNYYETKTGHGSEKKILQMIKKENPDIICLQEYFYAGNKTTSVDYIKESLGGRWHSHTKVINRKGNKSYGIVTLSRFPIIGRGSVIHPKSSSLTIYTDIIVGKDTLRVYNNHLQSFHLKRLERSFISDVTGEGQQSLKSIRTIYKSLVTGFASRSVQTTKVKKSVSSSPYSVIVAGDFNDTPVSFTYRKIKHGLNDAFLKAGYGAGYTYGGKYPASRIDYVLYDSKIECTDFDIIKVKYSDHYPVMAYFRKSH